MIFDGLVVEYTLLVEIASFFSHEGCKFNPYLGKTFISPIKYYEKRSTFGSLGSLMHHHDLFVKISLR